MKDYSKGKIYRLVCNTTDKQYIGSTVQLLSQRLGLHKSIFKRFIGGKSTKALTAFDILFENNYSIVLVEDYPCNNKDELMRRERYFIDTMPCVNKNNPVQTQEEKDSYKIKYREDPNHLIKMIQYQTKYRQKNLEKSRANTVCECGGHFQHKNKLSHFKSIRHTRWASTTPEIP